MKRLYLFVSVLLSACVARPHVPFTLPPSSGTVQIGNGTIEVFVPENADQAYTQLQIGLKRAGYQIFTNPPGAPRDVSTKPKTIAQVTGLSLQVEVRAITPGNVVEYLGKNAPKDALGQPIAKGSVVTFMGKYVPVDSLGQEERDSRKWRGIRYGQPFKNVPVQAFWEDMRNTAVECFPGARIGYM